jgi:hypothetical protein
MKKTILTSFIFILTTFLYGQEFKISVAPTINNALYYKFVAGGPGRNFKPGFSTSLDYSILNDKKVTFGFGICYQFAQVEYTPNMNTGDFIGQTDKVSLISFSFSTIYNLEYITDQQSGFGLSFSFGKHLNLNDGIQLNIEPKLWIHNIIPFQNENLPLRLTTCGLNLGIVFGKNKSQQPDE